MSAVQRMLEGRPAMMAGLGLLLTYNITINVRQYLIRILQSCMESKMLCFRCFQSQSSVLTDDEWRDAHFSKNGIEKTIRAVYAKTKVYLNKLLCKALLYIMFHFNLLLFSYYPLGRASNRR